MLNREFDKAAGKAIPGTAGAAASGVSSLTYLYPFGATLSVQKPAVPVLSSGTVALPVNRPVTAFYNTKNGKNGRLAVIGSTHLLQDGYLDKEENFKVLDVVMQWLTNKNFKLNTIDAEDPDVSDYHFLPATASLAEQLRTCLQEGDEIPRDFTAMHDKTLFNIGTSVIPDAIRMYSQLGVEHEPLQLITPQFETPLPPLQPAVFPPTFRELDAPTLDLFDLDDMFSSERVRLAQLTNKCDDKDLEYYVRECGEILGVSFTAPNHRPLCLDKLRSGFIKFDSALPNRQSGVNFTAPNHRPSAVSSLNPLLLPTSGIVTARREEPRREAHFGVCFQAGCPVQEAGAGLIIAPFARAQSLSTEQTGAYNANRAWRCKAGWLYVPF